MDRLLELQNDNASNPIAAGIIMDAMGNPDTVPVTPKRSPWARSDELLAMGKESIAMLVEGLFPAVGLAGIVGPSDSCKSMFARQLAIGVAKGEYEFLSHAVNVKHGSAIYVASEDSREASAYLLKKQWHRVPNDKLRFLFAEECEDEETIAQKIEPALRDEPADLVVIDTWGDLFAFDAERGSNANNEIAVRRLLGTYSHIAQTYNCLVLFVHHMRKSGSKEAPHKDHTSGSGAFERKLRCLIHLGIFLDMLGNPTSEDLRAMTIVKGNYLPRAAKEVLHILKWEGETFRLSDTGATMNLSEYGETLAASDEKREKTNKLDLYDAFEGIEREAKSTLAERLASRGVTSTTAYRKLSSLQTDDQGYLIRPKPNQCFATISHSHSQNSLRDKWE
ncbi:MAG TPA: AAA family ATPase [Candidatus Kapabacteria bacterium]|jgi:RecA/RadA recombinase